MCFVDVVADGNETLWLLKNDLFITVTVFSLSSGVYQGFLQIIMTLVIIGDSYSSLSVCHDVVGTSQPFPLS